MKFTGHLAGEKSDVDSSDCVCAGTKSLYLAKTYTGVDMLPWPLIAGEFHGVSSHTASVKTTKKGLCVHSEEASACMSASSMTPGS